MIYRFEDFELDQARFELRRAGQPLAAEPQVLSLLLLLASNPDRLVSKDEIIEKVWNGRFISEAAVSARIKTARQVLGDDGTQQRLLKTVHGKGFRFVGKVEFAAEPALRTPADSDRHHDQPAEPDRQGKPSIAVLPFRCAETDGAHVFLADALADELITDLARLRWLFVIARGSSFRFRGNDVDCRQAGQALGVRYCLTGRVGPAGGGGVTVSVELVEARDGGIVWTETYSDALERVHDLRREIEASVITALEVRIPFNEAQKARQHEQGELDAWSAYHLGLDHMFRFNRADNRRAAELFAGALEVDRRFARASAGLSFTRFQNAFLGYASDRAAEADAARQLAEQALQWDQFDPFCHFNMGRSFWLSGDLADSIDWLNRATEISPNYAQALYSKAWSNTLSGHAAEGERDASLALRLSPLDPLRYAMIATCALSQLSRGNYEEAAGLAERAARSPGAHKLIAVIAGMATSLAGRPDDAERWIALARRADPGLTAGDFLRSFPFAPSDTRETIERTLADLRM